MSGRMKPNRSMDDRPTDRGRKDTNGRLGNRRTGALQHNYADVTALIRSLQRSDGLQACFRTGLSDCDQVACPWRCYCLAPAGYPTGTVD